MMMTNKLATATSVGKDVHTHTVVIYFSFVFWLEGSMGGW